MMDLSVVKVRGSLEPRREPYWSRLRPGCFVGFRQSTREGAGSWIARAYDDATRGYRLKALGHFAEVPARDQYGAAKRAAEEFADLVQAGGVAVIKIETVGDACRAYAKVNPEAGGRFDRHVYGDPVARAPLSKLVRLKLQLAEWRKRLEAKPALVSRRKEGGEKTRPRAPASINRDMAMVKAALRKVLPWGPPGDSAWQEALAPIRNADRPRGLYLDRRKRRAMLEHAGEEIAPFVRGLCLLPIRPGALANLTAGDFDRHSSELTIGRDKNGRPRRIQVPKGTAEFLIEQSRRKLPAAPLFMRADGRAWTRETWKGPIAAAANAAGLPPGVTAYTLRHSTITDLVDDGLPMLWVAQLAGTSVEMIERTYGKLNRKRAARALAKLSL